MALGREEYNGEKYPEAADAFAKVDRNGADGLEAGFYRGLALMFSGEYPLAEQAFAGVARTLPLAEVVNNQAVAISRQGHDGTSLFIQAAASDPNAADYHFNLAVSLKRHGNTAGALNELAQCMKLRPSDNEALALEEAWKKSSPDLALDPLERIVRSFDAAAFKQAAAMLDQIDTNKLAALPAQERGKILCVQANSALSRGLLLEAERLFQDAITADAKNAQAHAGLAQVRERGGNEAAARSEAHAALELAPTANAYLLLARLDLAAGLLDAARSDTAEALKLEPANPAALELQRQIVANLGQK